MEQFGTWLLDGSHEGAIVIAHNFRGYDGYLILEWFYSQFLLPKLILNGAKMMSMELESANIKFWDSLNFHPMPLKALPKTFGLSELKKGYFPHYVRPPPPLENYNTDSMPKKKQDDFLTWYNELKNNDFIVNIHNELVEYCRIIITMARNAKTTVSISTLLIKSKLSSYC